MPTKLAVKEAGKGKNMTTTKEVSPGKEEVGRLLELHVSLMKTVCETAIDQQKVNIESLPDRSLWYGTIDKRA